MRGRRSKKNREERENDLQVAINRSSLTGPEVIQMLVNWLGWRKVTIEISDTVTQVVTKEGA
jgi:hypothetical protein